MWSSFYMIRPSSFGLYPPSHLSYRDTNAGPGLVAPVSSLRVHQGGQGSVAGLPPREAESGIHRLGWGWGCGRTRALSLEAEGLGL